VVTEPRPFLARRLPRWQLVAFDALAAAGLTVAHISFLYADDGAPSYTGPLWFGYVIAVLSALPLAVRRLWPMPVLSVLLVSSVLSTLLNATREPWAPVACTLYIVALISQSVVPLAASLISAAVAVGFNSITTPSDSFWDGPVSLFAFVAAIMVASWTSGRAVEARRSYAARSARQLAHSAVNDERLRIARELHDIVAHSMSLIAVKAGIANHIADQHPAEAREALRVIESTSRDTLNEMRHILGVLRSDTPSLTPVPGLSGLSDLAARAEQAGVRVTMTTPEASLPSGVEMSVYRIVQEALTNVVKHAGPVACAVDVTASPDEVRISVVDSGRGGTPGAGHGLIGMRERVLMYGGTFSAGPAPTGGFAVTATLPYAGVPA
jgi:signal transduction histidine kinase